MSGVELNTFSITARCQETGMLGVAVSTARPAVGGLAPYVKQGVGAISTQAKRREERSYVSRNQQAGQPPTMIKIYFS